MANNCPICGKDDQIKKVSSIVQSGISRSTGQIPVGYSYTDSDGKLHSGTNYENFSVTQMSNLARILIPPQMPAKPLGDFIYYANLIWSSLILFGASFVMAGSMIADMFGNANGIGILNSFLLSVTFLIIGIAYSQFLIRSRKKQKEVFNRDMPMWEQAIARWEKLYYCERDNSIFVSGEKAVNVSGMMEYLNWRPYRPATLLEKLLLWKLGW